MGLISEGEVTLHNCYEFHSHGSSKGFYITCFKASEIFIGHHFKREEDMKFNNIFVNYSNLYEWAGITGFKHKWEEDGGKLVEYEWKYSFPEVIENRLDGFDINISYYFVGGILDNFELNPKQSTLIDIHADDSLSFLDFSRKILSYIQDFLSLGVGEAVRVRYMTGRSEEAKTEHSNGKTIYNDIKIYYSTVVTESRKLRSDKMFFTLGDLDNSLEECLNNWFNKLEDLKPVYNLYFSTLYNPEMYLEQNFLNYAQALESYHRRMYGGTYMSNDGYKSVYNILVDQIPDSVKKDHKQSLEKRIEYGNAFSLRKRLKEIFKIIGDDIITKLIENKTNFIKDVVKTRNYYTHYSKELEEQAPDTKKLLKLTQKLRFLVEICFLVELGLSTDKIKEIVDRDKKHNFKLVE